ncbi:MAG: PAS domain S-box protein [Acidimicrobiales bacterium]|nr:PAS domain S-box protein [Acidimicrobiales bacterium]
MPESQHNHPDVGIPAAAICDAAPDGMVIVDRRGIILWVNLELEHLTGHTAVELLGQPIEVLIPEAARQAHVALRERYVETPVKRAMGAGVRLTARHHDGSVFPAHISLSAIEGPAGLLVLASIRNVTQWVEAERRLEEAQRRRAIAEDQERIARDLHDTVIQELFSIGLGLQALQVRVDDAETSDRLGAAIDQIDETIREVRTAIFDLHQQAAAGSGLLDAIVGLVDGLAGNLGFEPKLAIHGPIDHVVPDDVSVHLVPTIREALTNVARHAGASSAQVTIAVDETTLNVEVIDDGCGVHPASARRSGLENLAQRASLLGGTFSVEPGDAGGTLLRWCVPVARSPEPVADA